MSVDDSKRTVTLAYGEIDVDDIPLIMQEPLNFTYRRLGSWIGAIIIALLILSLFVVHAAYNQKQIRNITSDFLINERNMSINRCDLLSGDIDVPYSKYIEITIPKASFDSITQNQLKCLFSFYVTTTTGKFLQLDGPWFNSLESYKILLELPAHVQLQSLTIHTLIDQIFANGWQTTFRTFSIVVRDKTNRTIWRDTIILDFVTGDSTSGYIGSGYIPIQFDLDKYW